MATYSIKQLESLSGIKAHTIRIWEQRYSLLNPGRTESNIRLYNDRQLQKLLNISTLLQSGWKISEIADLPDTGLQSEIAKVIDEAKEPDLQLEALISKALIAAVNFDEELFGQVFSHALLRFGLEGAYQRFIYPLLNRVGLMWCGSQLIPAQEHFLSNLIRQKLFSAIDGLSSNPESPEKWLLFLDEEEAHETGLLFAAYLLRSRGKQVIYLGPSVPFENLRLTVKSCKPTHLYTFLVRNRSNEEASGLLKRLKKEFPGKAICVSAKPEMLSSLNTIRGITSIQNPEALLGLI